MSADAGEVEDGKGEVGEAAYLHLAGDRSGAALTELLYALSACGS